MKYQNECSQFKFDKVFDITKTGGIWLANEGKQFYKMRTKSQGEVDYATPVQVKVHPSKLVTQNASSSSTCNLPLSSKNVASSIASNILTSSETSEDNNNDCYYTVGSVEPPTKVRKTK